LVVTGRWGGASKNRIERPGARGRSHAWAFVRAWLRGWPEPCQNDEKLAQILVPHIIRFQSRAVPAGELAVFCLPAFEDDVAEASLPTDELKEVLQTSEVSAAC